MRTEADRAASKRWYDANKDTQLARVRKNKKERLAFLREAKNNKPCTDCGVVLPYYVLDWDHCRGTKEFGLASPKAQHVSMQRLLDEMAKCDLVCANCHRIRTWQRMPV